MEPEIVQLQKIDIEPNGCPIQMPLSITMHYNLTEPVRDAVWSIVYEADYTNKKQAISIFTSEPSSLAPGAHVFHHHAERITVDGIKEKYLLQIGVLKLTLHSRGEPITSVNLISQVSRDGQGNIIRNIISPTE